MKFNLTAGQLYEVEHDCYPHKPGKTQKTKGRFNKAFPCFDARFHGAGKPEDYIAYEFQWPESKLGTFTHYQKQIHNVKQL